MRLRSWLSVVLFVPLYCCAETQCGLQPLPPNELQKTNLKEANELGELSQDSTTSSPTAGHLPSSKISPSSVTVQEKGSPWFEIQKRQDISWEDALLTEREKSRTIDVCYPNFSDNPAISSHMKRVMAPYLLPLHSQLKPILDKIFAYKGRVIKNNDSLKRAGFTILFSQKRSFITVVKHPKLPGYLLKIYLDSKKIRKDGMVGWELLTTRCIVAQKIKRIIRKEKMRNFIVADKWLYPLPVPTKKQKGNVEPVVLVVKDMQIYGRGESRRAWLEKATKKHLRELYGILGRGYGSAFLQGNIPYTKAGKFAFIDTEYDKRKIPLDHVKHCLSSKMRLFWDRIVYGKGKDRGIVLGCQ